MFLRSLSIFAALVVLSLSMLQVNSAWSEAEPSGPNVVKAANIAYTHFASQLAIKYSGQEVNEEIEEFLRFMLNPRNYDMGVSQTNDLYIVVFLPRRTPRFENVAGGGGEYRIRKSDLSIIKFIGYE